MSRLVVLSHGFGTEHVFSNLFDEVVLHKKYTRLELEKDDVVVFEGGTDINPLLYDENPNSYTSPSDYARDAFEQEVFRQAVKKGIPMIGICRGAQLLCALSGGKLVQHVDGHGRDHIVEDRWSGEIYVVTSSHHQMMLPASAPCDLIAWTKHSTKYIGEYDKEVDVEYDAEIVYFPETQCLCIQGHPEWALNSRFASRCNELVEELFL